MKMKADLLVSKLKSIAENYTTLYVMGCFGAPLKEEGFGNKTRYKTNHSYNKKPERQKMIDDAPNTCFGFDCVNTIKAVLWGWNGDLTKRYGGACYLGKGNGYDKFGVPDTNADGMIKLCENVSSDFSSIKVGEFLWMSGHCGVYIGDGLAVECTPKWKNGVQITSVNCDKEGYNRRDWKKHGMLPWIEYTEEVVVDKEDDAKEELEYYKSYVEDLKKIIVDLNAIIEKMENPS